MKKPVRTTIVFALVSGMLVLPLVRFLSGYSGYPAALKWFLCGNLAIYALLLARWSRTRPLTLLFPLALALGAAFFTGSWAGFLALVLCVLCWVRSGICFSVMPLRALTAEVFTVLGGITLVAALSSNSLAAWPVGLCLFILVQALYFYIIPADRGCKNIAASTDPFEQARHEAEKALEQLP